MPVEQGNLDYFSEYIKLFFANVVLTTQLKELYSEREVLVKKLGVLEVTFFNWKTMVRLTAIEKSTHQF